eukprot:gene11881-biopygen7250
MLPGCCRDAVPCSWDAAGMQREAAGKLPGCSWDTAGMQLGCCGLQLDAASMQPGCSRDAAGMQRFAAGMQRFAAGMQRDAAGKHPGEDFLVLTEPGVSLFPRGARNSRERVASESRANPTIQPLLQAFYRALEM